MNVEPPAVEADSRIRIREINNRNPFASLAADVRSGLLCQPKSLQPKYFYDDHGSQLFERICDTPEYYPTRTEEKLLRQRSADIIARVKPSSILELGSGSSRKTTHLLHACDVLGCYSKYLPLDVCGDIMFSAGQALTYRYDWLEIEAFVGDYCQDLTELPHQPGTRLVVFLGGTIGNFYEHEALDFLTQVRSMMQPQDRLLLGADRVKDTDVLHAAYNDAQGYTAAFNLNVLDVINRELGACFDPEQFEHQAHFNTEHTRIEMHLRSLKPQTVPIKQLDMEIEFASDETILTEISRKFTLASLTALLEQAGFGIEEHYEPDNSYYSLVLAKPSPRS